MHIFVIPATIANGATESNLVDLAGLQIVALQIPASFTGATISFKDEADRPVVKDDGTAYSVTAADSSHVVVDHTRLHSLRKVKLVSASSETGAKVVGIVVRAL